MLVTKLARVYAKALIELALEQNAMDKVEADMKMVQTLINESRDFSNLLKSPVVKSDKKMAIFNEIFKGSMNALSLKFAEIVFKHSREASFNTIAQAYINMCLAQKGIETASVTTAYGLSDAELTEINKKVASLRGGKIELENKIDQSIIGGMVLRVGDHQFNGSIAAELKRLKRDFSENQYIADF